MRKPRPGRDDHRRPARALGFERDGDPESLERGEQHRAVPRVLGDLAAPLLALLLELLELRMHRGKELHDDRGGDVRHDADREDREPAEGPAREHVEHVEDRPALLLEERFERDRVDAGNRDERADPEDEDRAEDEQQPVPQLRHPAAGEGRAATRGFEGAPGHQAFTVPPAASMAARAPAVTATPLTVNARTGLAARDDLDPLRAPLRQTRRLEPFRIHLASVEPGQRADLDLVVERRLARREAEFRKAPLQRHLTTLEPGRHSTAGTGLLAFLPTAAGLAGPRPVAPADPPARAPGAGRRLEIVQPHCTSSTRSR